MTQHKDNAPRAASDEGWTVPVDPAKPGLGRRTILAGAAWSVPVIAASIATPLAAASCADATGTLDWGTQYAKNSPVNGIGAASVSDGRTVAVVVGATLPGSKAPSSTTVAGTPSGLAINNTTTTPNASLSHTDFMSVTITFAQPVYNLEYSISTINRNADFIEYVTASAGNVTFTSPGLINTDGWWHANPTDPAAGQAIRYLAPGPISSLTVYMSRPTLTNGSTGGVVLSDLTFTLPC